MRQAVILAGCLGRRLHPLTDSLPKPLAPVLDSRPFLDYLIDVLIGSGISRFLFLLGYKANQIIQYYSSLRSPDIHYSVGNIEDGTGQRLLRAYSALDDRFLLCYGDNYWIPDLTAMMDNFVNSRALVTTTVYKNLDGLGEYGWENNIQYSPDNRVIQYDKSRKALSLNGVDIGFFIVNKTILEGYQTAPQKSTLSFEEHVIPKIIEDEQMFAFPTDLQYQYITDPASLERFRDYAFNSLSIPLSSSFWQESGRLRYRDKAHDTKNISQS